MVNTTVSDSELQQTYGNRVLILREPYTGSRLRFDATGRPTKVSNTGPWTLYGQLRVQQVSLRNRMLHIHGHRSFIFYDPVSNQLRDIGDLETGDKSLQQFGKDPNELRE